MRMFVQVHPDVNPAFSSTDDAMRLNEAYAVLQLVSLAPCTVYVCQSIFLCGMGFLFIKSSGTRLTLSSSTPDLSCSASLLPA